MIPLSYYYYHCSCHLMWYYYLHMFILPVCLFYLYMFIVPVYVYCTCICLYYLYMFIQPVYVYSTFRCLFNLYMFILPLDVYSFLEQVHPKLPPRRIRQNPEIPSLGTVSERRSIAETAVQELRSIDHYELILYMFMLQNCSPKLHPLMKYIF